MEVFFPPSFLWFWKKQKKTLYWPLAHLSLLVCQAAMSKKEWTGYAIILSRPSGLLLWPLLILYSVLTWSEAKINCVWLMLTASAQSRFQFASATVKWSIPKKMNLLANTALCLSLWWTLRVFWCQASCLQSKTDAVLTVNAIQLFLALLSFMSKLYVIYTTALSSLESLVRVANRRGQDSFILTRICSWAKGTLSCLLKCFNQNY